MKKVDINDINRLPAALRVSLKLRLNIPLTSKEQIYLDQHDPDSVNNLLGMMMRMHIDRLIIEFFSLLSRLRLSRIKFLRDLFISKDRTERQAQIAAANSLQKPEKNKSESFFNSSLFNTYTQDMVGIINSNINNMTSVLRTKMTFLSPEAARNLAIDISIIVLRRELSREIIGATIERVAYSQIPKTEEGVDKETYEKQVAQIVETKKRKYTTDTEFKVRTSIKEAMELYNRYQSKMKVGKVINFSINEINEIVKLLASSINKEQEEYENKKAILLKQLGIDSLTQDAIEKIITEVEKSFEIVRVAKRDEVVEPTQEINSDISNDNSVSATVSVNKDEKSEIEEAENEDQSVVQLSQEENDSESEKENNHVSGYHGTMFGRKSNSANHSHEETLVSKDHISESRLKEIDTEELMRDLKDELEKLNKNNADFDFSESDIEVLVKTIISGENKEYLEIFNKLTFDQQSMLDRCIIDIRQQSGIVLDNPSTLRLS